MTMAKTAVMGAGSWGTAFALVLADAGNEVCLWGRREELCETINTKHENSEYLPGIELPEAIWARTLAVVRMIAATMKTDATSVALKCGLVRTNTPS